MPLNSNEWVIILVLFFFFLIFWLCWEACGILVPRLGIKLTPAAQAGWSLNHWTARAVPRWSHGNQQKCRTQCHTSKQEPITRAIAIELTSNSLFAWSLPTVSSDLKVILGGDWSLYRKRPFLQKGFLQIRVKRKNTQPPHTPTSSRDRSAFRQPEQKGSANTLKMKHLHN